MKIEGGGKKVPNFLHYYNILYVLVLALTCEAIRSLYSDVLLVSGWLDKDTVQQYVRKVIESSSEDNVTTARVNDVFATWSGEADLSTHDWLKLFAVSCPLWCLGTFIVCVVHSRDHIKIMQHKNEGKLSKNGATLWNDEIIFILALPMIYGLMSFKSVIRCLQICINHVPVSGQTGASATMYHSYEERKSFLLEMYAANFAVGDIFETLALVTFGKLISDYLNRMMLETKAEMTQHHVQDRNIAKFTAATETVANLTVAGVQLFCLACLMAGGWDLLVTTMPFYFPKVLPDMFDTNINETTHKPIGKLQQEGTRATAETFFLGFSFAASFAAIGNIMTLEENYHHFLDKFGPSLKFWGTKILVTLACVQAMVINSVFGSWSTIQRNLLYSCFLCLECFLIAIFHYWAWGADEEWLNLQHDDDPNMEPLLK